MTNRKKVFKKVVKLLTGWTLIQGIARIAVGIVYLPRLRKLFRESQQRQQSFEARHHLFETRQHLFETQQLPTLLQTVSEINHRQLASDSAQVNFAHSAPIALRKLTRNVTELTRDVTTTAGDVSNIQQQLTAFTESIQYLLGRVEFVRRELMFEMRYGASEKQSAQLSTKTEILSQEKLESARSKGDIQVNLGCGHIPLSDHLNVDRRALPGVDIVAEINQLPFQHGELSKIHSAHLLEHFPQEQLTRELLPYFFNLLKVGGVFSAIVPDADAMIKEYSSGRYPYDDMREVMYGAQDYDGDFHFNMFTPSSLKKLLEDAGFAKVEILDSGRKNGKCFELEISATKTKA